MFQSVGLNVYTRAQRLLVKEIVVQCLDSSLTTRVTGSEFMLVSPSDSDNPNAVNPMAVNSLSGLPIQRSLHNQLFTRLACVIN